MTHNIGDSGHTTDHNTIEATQASHSTTIAALPATYETKAHAAGAYAPINPASWTQGNATYSAKVPAATGVEATDNAAIQAAHDALPASGGWLQFQGGDYGVTGLVITKPIRMSGVGAGADSGSLGTRLLCSSRTANAVQVSANGCVIEDIAIVNTAGLAPTGGSGLLMTNATHARLRNVTVSGFYNNVYFPSTSGYYWKMDGCMILDPVNYGVYIANTTPTFDWGDPTFSGCTFTTYTTRTPAAHVRWEQGGGVKFSACKFNAGPVGGGALGGLAVYAVDFAVADGASTVDLVLTGCSLENVSGSLVRVTKSGGSNTGSFANIVLNGNEFGYSAGNAILVTQSSAGAGPTRLVSIDGNVFVGITGSPIDLDYCNKVSIGDSNVYETCGGPIIRLRSNVTQAEYPALPNVQDDSIILVQNDSVIALNTDGPFGNTNDRLVRALPAVNSNVTWRTLGTFDLPQYGAGRLDLTVSGQIEGIGSAYGHYQRRMERDAGNVTLTTEAVDVVGGAGSGSFDVQFDNTTVAGRVKVQIKLHAAVVSAGFHGEADLDVRCRITRLTKGDA